MHEPLNMQLFCCGDDVRHANVSTEKPWQEALRVLDVPGSVAEAKVAARMFWQCPDLSVREKVLARLCQAHPTEAWSCGMKMASLHSLSPSCLDSTLQALIRAAQNGELAVEISPRPT